MRPVFRRNSIDCRWRMCLAGQKLNVSQPTFPSAREWWEAIRWVVLVFTLLVAITLAGSFVSYETVTSQGHPWLPKIHCAGCLFCGMTRSFCAMSSGRWHDAWKWNLAGPFLYSFGWVWLGLCIYLLYKSKSYREERRSF